MRLPAYIGLLRGINVGGHNKLPMSDLRTLCTGLGWSDVQIYIQSGNVVFRAEGTAEEFEQQLEHALQDHLGLRIPVIVRSAAEWSSYVQGNPYAEPSKTEPQLVLLALSKAAPLPDALERVRERAAPDEHLTRAGDALWIHYGSGAGRSKLSPAVLDRLVGSPVTTHNWRTVLKLAQLVSQPEQDA